MSLLTREREAKLALLEALARSQLAVARMLDCAADLAGRFPPADADGVREQLKRLAALQLSLAATANAVKLRELRRGSPSGPWLAAGVAAGCRAGARRGGRSE